MSMNFHLMQYVVHESKISVISIIEVWFVRMRSRHV